MATWPCWRPTCALSPAPESLPATLLPRGHQALLAADMLADAVAMKRAGFNAVRCSHYPNHDTWYDICSRLGLYVIDEANVETHGFDPAFANNETHPACHPQWLPAILDRAVRMHAR